jgi:hypothetical protein
MAQHLEPEHSLFRSPPSDQQKRQARAPFIAISRQTALAFAEAAL